MDLKTTLATKSARVKSCDLHSTEPWAALGLYDGQVHIWDLSSHNNESKTLIKTLQVSEQPVRAVRFIPRRGWLVAGADDKHLHVFNCKTWQRVYGFEAHKDFIRSVAVHSTRPMIVTGGDDHSIRMWNFDESWKLVRQFPGHTHYVMSVEWNPYNELEFASASLDKSIRIWRRDGDNVIGKTLEGHVRGVNCVLYTAADRIVSGGDDSHIKLWDTESGECIQTLEGHSGSISALALLPKALLSSSEDGSVRIWRRDDKGFVFERALECGMQRSWALSVLIGSDKNVISAGFDDGALFFSD